MRIVIAENGQFLETIAKFASDAVVVLPHGVDWSPVTESACAFEALQQHPLERLPTHPLATF